MADATARSLDDELVSRTDDYLDSIAACVSLIPELLDADANADENRDAADEISRIESECDEANRRIAGLVSNATVQDIGLRNTRIHLNSTQLVELYQRLDAVTNAAERIAAEFVTVDPPLDGSDRERFHDMATMATSAMSALVDAVHTFVRLLCSHDRTGSIAAEIRRVREIESDCDRVRNEIVADAFDGDGEGDGVVTPLVLREFAFLFDELVDAMEDATDQLVLLSSGESWITTEPGPDP